LVVVVAAVPACSAEVDGQGVDEGLAVKKELPEDEAGKAEDWRSTLEG
jgi:hypothetical protein